ncbi:hypothetical protein L914_14813 [Phytophthora nicotianae]|uniref:Uncharacterized protein n=1 Tax=Phytophthora nicotianae TaxID=4792 RepID=W2MRI3_PHYNI|nr:hypothetical protein L914_14813 [Phytophthora nicotianae]
MDKDNSGGSSSGSLLYPMVQCSLVYYEHLPFVFEASRIILKWLLFETLGRAKELDTEEVMTSQTRDTKITYTSNYETTTAVISIRIATNTKSINPDTYQNAKAVVTKTTQAEHIKPTDTDHETL